MISCCHEGIIRGIHLTLVIESRKGLLRAILLFVSARDVVAGRQITVIKTYSEEPEYFGWYNGQTTRVVTPTCDLENVRDVFAKSVNGQTTWGLVSLSCNLKDGEAGAKMVTINKVSFYVKTIFGKNKNKIFIERGVSIHGKSSICEFWNTSIFTELCKT